MDIMTPEQAAEAAKGLTFEKVWVALMESRERTEKEQRELRERMDQTYQEMKKTVEELSKNVGGVNNTLGELTEQMFSSAICEKFAKLGFTFTKLGPRQKFQKEGKAIAEADFFLENGEYVMAVEVKTKLTNDKIDEHIERIEKIRTYMDERSDARKIVGAVAGGVMSDKAIEYAHSNGLYVISPSGDTVAIATTPEGFKLKEW